MTSEQVEVFTDRACVGGRQISADAREVAASGEDQTGLETKRA